VLLQLFRQAALNHSTATQLGPSASPKARPDLIRTHRPAQGQSGQEAMATTAAGAPLAILGVRAKARLTRPYKGAALALPRASALPPLPRPCPWSAAPPPEPRRSLAVVPYRDAVRRSRRCRELRRAEPHLLSLFLRPEEHRSAAIHGEPKPAAVTFRHRWIPVAPVHPLR
jgi:hypothetical protein